MRLDLDDDILQDFLVEAGEILEQLNEQLVDLEQQPDNLDLLNAVFRGFHTIKGGAGFIGLDAMVDVCHQAEDTFNLLRNGERRADASLMDVMLQVLDVLHEMFDVVRGGVEPAPAPDDLMARLAILASNGELPPGGTARPAVAPAPPGTPGPRRSLPELQLDLGQADRGLLGRPGHHAEHAQLQAAHRGRAREAPDRLAVVARVQGQRVRGLAAVDAQLEQACTYRLLVYIHNRTSPLSRLMSTN